MEYMGKNSHMTNISFSGYIGHWKSRETFATGEGYENIASVQGNNTYLTIPFKSPLNNYYVSACKAFHWTSKFVVNIGPVLQGNISTYDSHICMCSHIGKVTKIYPNKIQIDSTCFQFDVFL